MYWAVCCVLVISVTQDLLSHAAPPSPRSGRNAMLESGVKTLMGYRDLPVGEKGVVRGGSEDRVIPRYMMDLYSQYRDTDIQSGAANTVRSVSAGIGLVNGDSMFIFNLTAIGSTEHILSSDVHIYRKKRRSDSTLTVTLYELAPYYITELGQSRLRDGKSGWQVFSVTDAVKSCLATRRAAPHILAIGFSRPKTGGALKRLQLKAFIHHISRPFLVVHSNSNVNITEDHIHARLTTGANTYIDPESGKTQKFRKNKKVLPKQETKKTNKVTVKEEIIKSSKETEDTSEKLSSKQDTPSGYKQEVLKRKLALQKKQNDARRKRSILTNEIPEDPSVPLIPPSKPSNRPTNTRQTNTRPTNTRPKQFSMEDFDFSDKHVKKSVSQENRKKRRRKQKNKGLAKKSRSKSRERNELGSPEQWGLEDNERRSPDRKLCANRKLTLDFTDIGWSNWIIAPKAFESNYCGGSCPYPQAQNLPGLSNHATLQSLVHAVAINPEVPAPCCVPAEMTSLSVLYFDQYDNVVLKNYPNMAVKSCECR